MNEDETVVWLIGGTGEAVTLAHQLASSGIACLVTVTTAAARQAYGAHPNLTVRVRRVDVSALGEFMADQRVGAVLDASHPFAMEISRGAIAAAQCLNLPYWRYERPELETPLGSGLIQYLPGLDAVLTPEVLAGERVLLTLGYRWLHHFTPWQTQATLFARILPSTTALEAALSAGFTSDRLIALRPPIGPELEAALWQQWQITRVITKASGAPGGEDTKRAIAQQLGTSLLILNRPQLDYPVVCRSQPEALARCQAWRQSSQSPT